MPPRETKKALIVVRTYPLPATPGVEVSCTAAITDDGKWLRLYPVPYRFLDNDKKFRKYQWIEVDVTKSSSDARVESYNPDVDSIKILSEPLDTANQWRSRKNVVLPLKSHCLCCLKAQRDENGYPTLGLVRPKSIGRLMITPADAEWSSAQRDMLRQGHLFREGPKVELEKIPFNFSYRFHCDHDGCKGHTGVCTDWEMGESWRKWSREYGDDQWEEKFRQRYATEMIERNDTHFYMGTIHQHPHIWIIVGLFYPPKDKPMPLLDSTIPDEG